MFSMIESVAISFGAVFVIPVIIAFYAAHKRDLQLKQATKESRR